MKLSDRPLFVFLLAYCAGIVLAGAMDSPYSAGVVTALFLLATAISICVRAGQKSAVVLVSAVFAIGLCRETVFGRPSPMDLSAYANDAAVAVTGTVASDVEALDGRIRFTLRAEALTAGSTTLALEGSTLVTVYGADRLQAVPGYGDRVRVDGRLSRPLGRRNPGGADYGRYLARKRVFCTLGSWGDSVRIINDRRGGLRDWVAAARGRLADAAERRVPGTMGGLLLGLLLGSYASLPLSLQSAFMRTGTMHLLAASGFNCAIVAAAVAHVMRRLTAPRALTSVVTIVALWLFIMVAGGGPSLVRAGVMLSLFLASYLLRRPPDMLNIVFAAALALLAANPMDLFDVGFQLSFAAVLSIVLAMPLLDPTRQRWIPAPSKRQPAVARMVFWTAGITVEACLVSMVTFAGTWPIVASYFNYVSPISIVANALTAGLVSAAMLIGGPALLIGIICPFLGTALAWVARAALYAMVAVVTGLGSVSWASLSVPTPSPYVVGFYYLALIGALEYAYHKLPTPMAVAGADSGAGTGPGDMAAGVSAG